MKMRTLGQGLEGGQGLRSRRLEAVRAAQQVVLEDQVHRVDVVENEEHEAGVFWRQPVEVPANDVVKAVIGPTLDIDELGVGLLGHVGPFRRGCVLRSD